MKFWGIEDHKREIETTHKDREKLKLYQVMTVPYFHVEVKDNIRTKTFMKFKQERSCISVIRLTIVKTPMYE